MIFSSVSLLPSDDLLNRTACHYKEKELDLSDWLKDVFNYITSADDADEFSVGDNEDSSEMIIDKTLANRD
jgi:hypothetical protein